MPNGRREMSPWDAEQVKALCDRFPYMHLEGRQRRVGAVFSHAAVELIKRFTNSPGLVPALEKLLDAREAFLELADADDQDS